MRIVTGVLLCALTLASSGIAAADSNAMTVADLQKMCTNESADSKAACSFYILGITQGVSLGISIADGKTNGSRPCVPATVSGSALELAVKMKLGEDLMVFPEDKKLDAASFIGAILANTFPCRKAR